MKEINYKGYDVEKNENEEVIPQADIEKEIDNISNKRGQSKSSVDAVQRLEYLLTKTDNPFLNIKILSEINLMCFDNYTKQFSVFPLSLWEKVYNNIEKLIEIHDKLIKEKKEEPNKDIENMSLILQNNLSTMMEKLGNELYKSL